MNNLWPYQKALALKSRHFEDQQCPRFFLKKADKIMEKLFKYIRRDLKGTDGKEADTYLLQDKSPITIRF